MLRRQAVLALTGTLSAASSPHYQVGDWVEVIALPPYAYVPCHTSDMQRHVATLRRRLRMRYWIVYIGTDGRPELDIIPDAAAVAASIGDSTSPPIECGVPAK